MRAMKESVILEVGPLPLYGDLVDQQAERVRQLRAQGVPCTAIGARLGISADRVRIITKGMVVPDA